ncbi:MAG TPA: glycosyltransferase 87 family protein [Candidatus Limnocylindria bacterium]|jgi:glycosyl transferase family 87/glycosyl transferase family 2|nr:glycosyltransferase 87 family protein [Candidatus Limnocylindria bacterium]
MRSRPAPRWKSLGYAAAAGAGLGSFLAWAGYWFTFIRGNLQGPDFFSFYSAAKLYVLQGGSAVYDLALQRQMQLQVTGEPAGRFIVLPYFHPPYYTLLIAPLAYLNYRQAYIAMAAFNALLAAALVVILVRSSLRVHGRAAIVATALIVGFFPLFVTLLQGQSDLVVLVPLAAAYVAWSRGRLGWAGIFSALALAKPQLLLLIPVLFVARRAWRALAGFAGVIAAMGLVSLAGFGFSPVLGYLNSVGVWAIGGSLPSNGQLVVYTDTAVYSLRNILQALPGGGTAALVILLVLLALVALSLSWRPDKPRLDFALAIAASLVLSPHQNVHDLALLVIPGFALADLALDGGLRWPRAAAVVLILSYAAMNLTLAFSLWSAAAGALALAAYLTVERLAVKPDPIPVGEFTWRGPRPHRVIVLPAYRAAKTLMEVVGNIPAGHADRILLVDDASADATVSVATALSLDVILHKQNLGYGGNQKTCYRHALEMGADVVVMLHPDGQYDPAIIPILCKVIEDGEADIVLGSRWLGLDPARAGMPWWKMLGNRFLTGVENRVLGLHLSEYHTGYRAYSRRFLEAIPFLENSNDFVFDTQVLIQAATFGFKIGEVPAIGKYHEDASSVSFQTSTIYGLQTLQALARYVLHRAGFPSAWLKPASDGDIEPFAVSQVAHHGHIQ